MDSPTSALPCESLSSVDSATTSEEEGSECGASSEFFLSDSSSDAEKEVGPIRSWLDAYPDGQSFLYSLKSRWTNTGLLCHAQKSLGELTSAWLQPSGRRCYHSAALDKSYCTGLKDAGGRLPRKATSQRRMERSGRKWPGGARGRGWALEHAVQPFLAGIRRHHGKELDAEEDSCPQAWTEGDQLFAQKCQELQGFILPLQELLGGLKMGRFDRGLSTFQQSVAMDRIQRIIGVLQKPGMGERYLGTLLQVERMLKVWFPHVALRSSRTNCGTGSENAAEMAKKPVPMDTLVPGEMASSHDSAWSPPTEELHQTHLIDSASSDGKAGALLGEPTPFLADWPTMNLTWIHTSPISNPPLGHVNSAFRQAPPSTYGILLLLHNSPAPSGSGDGSTPATPALPHPACVNSSRLLPGTGELQRCQSHPGTMQQGGDIPSALLVCHSKSLPHLPTSGGNPTHYGNS